MPTDLPPDYKPQPANDPVGTPVPAPGGEDSRDPMGTPRPAPNAGMPGPEGDVVDPPGWGEAGGGGIGVPQPAGTPSF